MWLWGVARFMAPGRHGVSVRMDLCHSGHMSFYAAGKYSAAEKLRQACELDRFAHPDSMSILLRGAFEWLCTRTLKASHKLEE